ncbi:uncharacterized protein I303_102983 [Kwoniella dejecticola CBS 10117]|uniref:Small nuclear ribonucleoprotein Prp3 C-terminal domain-containing protein n=1 Tax=Kwoniella dejecticola CBS 10117 TaxID=1296121 RepID=A0A1A6AA98_9TREE|nr:uncharacterized protein I303_03003 [Kwoniella dejecticola CBS 10117]OBR86981.1 hypothetical protein I303_03003 [Kwoniella dejecticola CBS 10117]
MTTQPELEAQLDLLQLLTSMYTSTELILPEDIQSILDQYIEDPSSSLPPIEQLTCELDLPIDEYGDSSKHVQFQINLSVGGSDEKVKIRPKQPTFLNRSQYQALLDTIPSIGIEDEPSEHILNTVEIVKSALQAVLEESKAQISPTDSDMDTKVDEEIIRVWFWLPSLSTREKRDDMVNFAKEVGLTGFVLAGKPGLLAVEGGSQVIDKYMSRIKSESWSDIPKHHKKITERLRRPLTSPEARAFQDMREITDTITHYGQYNHRGDMSEVKKLMDQWGVGEDFGAVIMNSGA